MRGRSRNYRFSFSLYCKHLGRSCVYVTLKNIPNTADNKRNNRSVIPPPNAPIRRRLICRARILPGGNKTVGNPIRLIVIPVKVVQKSKKPADSNACAAPSVFHCCFGNHRLCRWRHPVKKALASSIERSESRITIQKIRMHSIKTPDARLRAAGHLMQVKNHSVHL